MTRTQAMAARAIDLAGSKSEPHGVVSDMLWAANALARIRAICEDGERSGADRLDEIYRIVAPDVSAAVSAATAPAASDKPLE